MVLIDSSIWVHYSSAAATLPSKNRARDLIEAGQAAWCAFVRLELWNGVGSDADRRMLREHEIWLPDLPIAGPVWQDACELASRCRRVGKSAPANDVLIAACARQPRTCGQSF